MGTRSPSGETPVIPSVGLWKLTEQLCFSLVIVYCVSFLCNMWLFDVAVSCVIVCCMDSTVQLFDVQFSAVWLLGMCFSAV